MKVLNSSGVFTRVAFRALPSIPKPSPTWQQQLRGPGLLREPDAWRRAPPTRRPQHAFAGPQVHRQLCRLLLSLTALQWAQLWDKPLSSLTGFLGLGGYGSGGEDSKGWTAKSQTDDLEARRETVSLPPPSSLWFLSSINVAEQQDQTCRENPRFLTPLRHNKSGSDWVAAMHVHAHHRYAHFLLSLVC